MPATKKAAKRTRSKTTVDVPTRDGWVRRHWGQEAPSYEKLQEAIAALEGARPINIEMRRYISDVLDYFFIRLHSEEDQHQRGRREDWQMQFAARIAIVLVDRYDATVKAAIGAMLKPAADPKLFQRLERTYSKLRKGGGPYQISERLIEEVAQRLSKRPQIGNK